MRRLLPDPFEGLQGGEVLLPLFLSGVVPVGARATRAVAAVRLLVPSLALSTGVPPWAPGAPRLASPFPLSPPVLSLLRLASPLVALAGPSLPFPLSLPLPPPPFCRFHVTQDVPGCPPLGRAVVVVTAAVNPFDAAVMAGLVPRALPSYAPLSFPAEVVSAFEPAARRAIHVPHLCVRWGPPSTSWDLFPLRSAVFLS